MLQVLAGIFWMLLVPFGCGMWITSRLGKECQTIGNIFVNGYLVMIALFQFWYLLFFAAGSISFKALTWVFAFFIVIVAGVSAWFGRTVLKDCFAELKNKDAALFKVIFFVLIAVQLVMRLVQQVSDGDDAYYIALASGVYTSECMNMVDPYTGVVITYIDYRHAFASAPLWLAFLSKVVMIHPAAMAHSVLSLVLIVLHYMIILNIGRLLFKEKVTERYLFASIVSLYNIYGYVSIYTAQTFLLTRTWQGKSIFANLLLPMLFLMLLQMGEKEKKEKLEAVMFVLAGVVMFAGSAMTVLAVVMLPALFMLGVLFLAIYRKSPWILLKGMLACLPSAVLGIAFILV